MLNNLATYYMCSYLLPRGVIESIDKRHRAFFWTGKDSCSGARCLIAWDRVLLSKQEGGFGIKDLHRQNMCLLLNFVHQLHQPNPLPWKKWVFSHIGRDLGETSPSPSFLEKIVDECLPLHRSITRVIVVDGRSTSFWMDKWLPGELLATRFPALFSHNTRRHVTVATVVETGLDLQVCLTSTADEELRLVHCIIEGSTLRVGCDLSTIDSSSTPRFCSREAYRALAPANPRRIGMYLLGPPDPFEEQDFRIPGEC
jgi:hypothetical protein